MKRESTREAGYINMTMTGTSNMTHPTKIMVTEVPQTHTMYTGSLTSTNKGKLFD